jgi:Protein of unknown function (DUF1838)
VPPDVLGDARDNLDAFVRVRGSKNGEDTVYYWRGSVYSDIEGQRSRQIFDFEGFNVARTVPDGQGGWQLLSREIAVYRDPASHRILDAWVNPWTNKTVHVVPVLNDPVSTTLHVEPGDVPLVPADRVDDDIFFNLDVFLKYPSPLPKAQYPQYSGSDTYQGAELFQFTTPSSALDDHSTPSVPATLSWTRQGPWLPWMEMGDAPGRLVYQCHGAKLEHGISDLPMELRDHVLANHPAFLTAPTAYTSPNETSWTYFKKLVDSGAYPPGD